MGFYSPEPRAEVYCFRLNFNISKLVYSNPLHTELSLGNSKDTKFYLKSKASFIHISSIASFKPLLIAWSWEYCTFWPGQFSGLLEVLVIVLCVVI